MKVAIAGLHDRNVIALWFDKSDQVSTPVICDAAVDALHDGRTYAAAIAN